MEPVHQCLETLIKASGGVFKEGAAPPDNLEREIQKMLDEFN